MGWVDSLSTVNLSADRLTPGITLTGIRSLKGFGNLLRPLAQSVLYHHQLLPEAIPKDISRRTSYHGIRLAFHPYPQLIRAFFNIHRFGPPPRVNKASPWSWLDHPASGLINETGRPFKTRFRYGSTPQTGLNLASFNNSPDHYAKGTRLH